MKICSLDGCYKRHYGKGYCRFHWERIYRGRNLHSGFRVKQETIPKIEFFKTASGTHDKVNCIFWPFQEKRGNHYVSWGGNPFSKFKFVSRAMCEYVYGAPPSPTHHAAHLCGNGHLGCINPLHLEWQSPQRNAQGPKRSQKLTMADAKEIKRRKSAGERTIDLSREFRVTRTMVKFIVSGQRWKENVP